MSTVARRYSERAPVAEMRMVKAQAERMFPGVTAQVLWTPANDDDITVELWQGSRAKVVAWNGGVI